MNNELSQLLNEPNLRCCRKCRQFLSPPHGALRQESIEGFTPRSIRLLAERVADDESGTYFECYDCEAKRKRRKLIFYGSAS